MARFEIFAVGLILAIAFNFVAGSSDEIQSDIQVSVVSDMDEYLNENPDFEVQPLIKEIKENGPSQYFTVVYRLGKRIAGDSLATEGSGGRQLGRIRNIKLTFTYPAAGSGVVVTYVEISVDQSTNLGRAYFISGGIGQKQFRLVIEAQSTDHYYYKASIFGKYSRA